MGKHVRWLDEDEEIRFSDEPGLGDSEYPGFPADVVPSSMPDLR